MTYIRYKDTFVGDFYFSYEKQPQRTVLEQTALQLKAKGGYEELKTEEEFRVGLKNSEDQLKERGREHLSAYLEGLRTQDEFTRNPLSAD